MTDMIRTHGYDPRGPRADSSYGNRPITDTRDAVAEALDDARQAWRDWQAAWNGVTTAMSAAGMSTERIEAYRVGEGYDEGGGQSHSGWLDEIEREVDGDPRSCYVIQEDARVDFRRVDYDSEITAQKIYDTPDLNDFLGDRIKEGR